MRSSIGESTPTPAGPGVAGPPIEDVDVAAYTVPTDQPEADGTLAWSSTTMVVVRVQAGGTTGLGWTYGPAACGRVVEDLLAAKLVGSRSFDIPAAVDSMTAAVRNAGHAGVAAYAISAVDVALWDLKARLLEVPLTALLGRARTTVPVYGSGGFTTYDDATMTAQLRDWTEHGIPRVKIKIGEDWGRSVQRDLERVRRARDVVGADVELYVDANGAYQRKQAMRVGRQLEDLDVRWFEEPVSSDDKDGLSVLRDGLDLDVTAGEYATDLYELRRLCGVVDCLQVDASRCGGITGWMDAAALAASYGLEVSAHCAPHLHLAAVAATPNLRHVEYFHDHVRIEQRYLAGSVHAEDGAMPADSTAPGHGFELRDSDLEQFRVA